MKAIDAQLIEVFSSIQGEGLYIGERQIFIRFAGCNLSCQYCDSIQALELLKQYKIELIPGSHKFAQANNPCSVEQLIASVQELNKQAGLIHSIGLTGGEPLLQIDFLKSFLPAVKQKVKLPIYLETNGTLPDRLEEVIEEVDIVAMDVKLSSATGQNAYWKEHKNFLEIALMKSVFVKVVFVRETNIKEIEEASALVAGVDENVSLVLQPVSPAGAIKHRPTAEQIFAFQAMAKRKLKNVRVIPQIHKMIGLQ